LLISTDGQLLRTADWAEHARILLVLQSAFVLPAAFPGAGYNELDSKLAEHLRQTRSGRTVAVVLDALRIVA
jgi:hypothetical protein